MLLSNLHLMCSHNAVYSEAELFDSIANKMVLRKEQLLDRFRTRLWRESTEPAPTEEDRLVVELLLEDERQAMEDDKLLEQTDIGLFASPFIISFRCFVDF